MITDPGIYNVREGKVRRGRKVILNYFERVKKKWWFRSFYVRDLIRNPGTLQNPNRGLPSKPYKRSKYDMILGETWLSPGWWGARTSPGSEPPRYVRSLWDNQRLGGRSPWWTEPARRPQPSMELWWGVFRTGRLGNRPYNLRRLHPHPTPSHLVSASCTALQPCPFLLLSASSVWTVS